MKSPDRTQRNLTHGGVSRLEALGTPSGAQRKHGRSESKADVDHGEKKGDAAAKPQPVVRAERRAIRFPHRIEGG